MRRIACVLLAAAGLVAGCGEQPSSAPVTPSLSPSPVAVIAGLEVTQEGGTPPNTVWYARIETMDAKVVMEKDFRSGPIAFTHPLAPGQYRLMSWYRACERQCPASGEKGLGPLVEVCGAPVTVAPDRRITMAVVIDGEGACTIRAGS